MAKSLRDPKRKPTHPGAILREDILPVLGLYLIFSRQLIRGLTAGAVK